MIGNGAYANLDPLKNPVNDASDIANSLRSLGFEVMSGTDLTKAGMTALIGDFLEAAQHRRRSFFYYAGHGFQIDGRNFLVPVDASLKSRADIENWTHPARRRSATSSKARRAFTSSSSTPAAPTRSPRSAPALAAHRATGSPG